MKTILDVLSSYGKPGFATLSIVRNTDSLFVVRIQVRPDIVDTFLLQESTGRLIAVKPITEEAMKAATIEAKKMA